MSPTTPGTDTPSIHRARYETFGGIVSCLDPPFLAWVDKQFMRELGYGSSELWSRRSAYLSAPTEVHLAVTNRCSQRCASCYMDSGSCGEGELSTEQLKTHLKTLADMGVFHVALGGGEAFEREDFGEIVRYCRDVGLVPNLTTNGQHIGPAEIEVCRLMGQVNISLDGIGGHYGVNGRHGDFARADAAARRLVEAGVGVGINCVVSSRNVGDLAQVVAYAHERSLSEVELLKYKPSGRGSRDYATYALSQEQLRSFYPLVKSLQDRYSPELKIDCSFIPALLYHRPPAGDLEKVGASGCDGGNVLLGVRSNGAFSACSFVSNDEPIGEIRQRWHSSAHLARFRDLTERLGEPCRSCDYLKVCRGGCRAVALHFGLDFFEPDPECPFVYDYQHSGGTV